MNNKVFISGKVTGYPYYRDKFETAEVEILSVKFFGRHFHADASKKSEYFGFRPINPCNLKVFGRPLEDFRWSVCMAVCIWHLAWCSRVYFLNNWRESRGARLEHKAAKFLGKQIIYQP